MGEENKCEYLPILQESVSAIVAEMPVSQVAAIYGAIGKAKEKLRQIDAACKMAVISWMHDNGAEVIELDDTNYIQLANKSTDRQAAPREILHAVLEKTLGDLDAIAACLSSGAFKQAATKKLIGNNEELFWKETTETLVLQEHNTETEAKFLKRGK